MKLLTSATIALALTVAAQAASASCDAGEMVIKFSHVTTRQWEKLRVELAAKLPPKLVGRLSADGDYEVVLLISNTNIKWLV